MMKIISTISRPKTEKVRRNIKLPRRDASRRRTPEEDDPLTFRGAMKEAIQKEKARARFYFLWGEGSPKKPSFITSHYQGGGD